MAHRSLWTFINRSTQIICAMMSVTLNSLLIYLIFTKSHKMIGRYKYLMIYICVFEVLYSFVDVITEPYVHSYASRVLVIVNVKYSMFSREVNQIFEALICGFYGCSMAIFAVQFIYRYGSLHRSHRMKFFGNRSLFLWCLLPIVYGTVWSLIIYYVFPGNPMFTEIIRKDILNYYDFQMEDVVYSGPFYFPTNPLEVLDWKVIGGLCVMWFLIISCMFSVIFFGLSTYFHLRKSFNLHEQSSNLQRQLFFALVLQATIPFILLYIPVAFVLICALLQIDLGNISAIISYTVALYPAIDPVPTMYVIRDYRVACINMVRGLKMTPTLPASAVSVSNPRCTAPVAR